MFQSKREGFTLVEIMIVVAIIGMLAGLAIPNFIRSRNDAQRVGCINNLRQVEGAILTWSMEAHKDESEQVSYNDIRAYLRNQVFCPAGGITFQDSYRLGTVSDRPVCLRKPDTHLLAKEP